MRQLGAPPPPQDPSMSVDPAWARSLLLRTLERVERGESKNPKHQARVTNYLAEWQADDRIVIFVRVLTDLLKLGLAVGETDDRIQALIEVGLARWLDLPDKLPSAVRTAELDRVVKVANDRAWASGLHSRSGGCAEYAASNQLTVRRAGQVEVSKLGQVLLDLQGRDAIRWLLHVEAHQALGPEDPDRVSRQGAASMLSNPNHIWPNGPETDEWPCHGSTELRLQNLGILHWEHETGLTSVTRLGQEILGELVKPDQSPLALLVESLCADLLTSTVQKAAPAVRSELAAEATVRQARMFSHEVSNALLPVQMALAALYEEALVLPPSEAIRRRRPDIDAGIASVLRFTRDLRHTAELSAAPEEPFDPRPAIDEAILEFAHKIPIQVNLPDGSLPLLRGNRADFVTAMKNVTRNAIQHGGAQIQRVHIGVEIDQTGKALTVTVDDDGPGIPESDRDRIFQEGFSRKQGGAGFGLHWVKGLVEKDWRGVIRCTDSPLGGARFVLRLPVSPAHPIYQGVRR